MIVALLASACGGLDGHGRVRVDFDTPFCKPGTPRDLAGYAFDAEYLATERFAGNLSIILQAHRVDVEESDGLVILLSLDELIENGTLMVSRGQLVRRDPRRPIVISTSTRADDASAALSLFQTCPEFPTHFAYEGVLSLSKLTLAEMPEDTGEGERLAGTLTATIGRANAKGAVGRLEAEFDFAPPRRPLTELK